MKHQYPKPQVPKAYPITWRIIPNAPMMNYILVIVVK